jgi:hypothetical protein
MNVVITLTTAGPNTGPFNLFSDVDGYTIAFETDVSRAALMAGFPSSNAPDGTSLVRVQSVGVCTNSILIPVPGMTTTTTTTPIPTTTTTTTLIANLLRVNSTCCGNNTERLVNLPALLGFGPTATFTGTDGKPYTLISSIMVSGTANVFQNGLDTTIYSGCAMWLAYYITCPP